jgi:hypothetical protein
MTRTVTTTAVKRIITKGLTGWQAGKLILQDMIDSYVGRDSVLTEADMATIQQTRMEGADVRDYNMFMALCRGFHWGYVLAQWSCKDACLEIGFLDRALEDADTRRTVELFESFGPRVVARKQYEEIVAAQREKKLAFDFGLGYVIEKQFYAIAPPEAKTAIDEAGVDIESVGDFVAVVPEGYDDLCKLAIDEIHRLHTSGKLPAVYSDQDAKEVKPLLKRWKKSGLSPEEAIRLVDRLYVTGQTLYGCQELPEWKSFIDRYQQHWFDDDARFRHAYAVLEDCPEMWLNKKGHYKGPVKPTVWITRSTESLLGLTTHDGKTGKSIKYVGAGLQDRLHTAEQDVRMLLTVKAVLDAAADAVGLDVASGNSVLAVPDLRLNAFVHVYNLRLEELKEGRRRWESGETRLEKALQMLPAIDPGRLRPTADSMKKLKGKILDDARGEDWLRIKVQSLECGDGISFKELLS